MVSVLCLTTRLIALKDISDTMRLCLTLRSEEPEQRLPLSHLDRLYDLLESLGETPSSEKTTEPTAVPLSFSDLRVPAALRTIDGAAKELVIAPGKVLWWIASPDAARLKRLATRLVDADMFSVGAARFTVAGVQLVPFPSRLFGSEPNLTRRFSCWTPIVSNTSLPDVWEIENTVRLALLQTHEQVYGVAPTDDAVRFALDLRYLARHPRSGSKRIEWRGENVFGILAPFTLTAPSSVHRIVYDCGIGGRTGQGFGFAEMTRF